MPSTKNNSYDHTIVGSEQKVWLVKSALGGIKEFMAKATFRITCRRKLEVQDRDWVSEYDKNWSRLLNDFNITKIISSDTEFMYEKVSTRNKSVHSNYYSPSIYHYRPNYSYNELQVTKKGAEKRYKYLHKHELNKVNNFLNGIGRKIELNQKRREKLLKNAPNE